MQISHGQINSLAPVFSPDGKKLFIIGQQLRGELQHFDSNSRKFVPYLNGMSADFVEFSRDRKWLLYVAFPEGTLWRSKADGSDRLQLTYAPMQVMVPHWSPDGKQILFHGVGGGRDEVYTISVNGGEPLPVAKDSGKQIMNETWSPDGNSIAYSDYPFFGKEPFEGQSSYSRSENKARHQHTRFRGRFCSNLVAKRAIPGRILG